MMSNFVCGVNCSVEPGVFGSLAVSASGNKKIAVAKREKKARFIRGPRLRLIIFPFGVHSNARKTTSPAEDAGGKC
jgi:hypothetical protein